VEAANVLESIAEVAIALAGFGGIAAGIGYRAHGGWSSDDRLRLMLLAGTGLTVVFGCFVPHVLELLGSTSPWRTASALFLLFPAFMFLYQIWFLRRGLPAGYSRIATLLVIVANFFALALLLIATLGYAEAREAGFYVSAVLLGLFQSSMFFFRLLATSFRSVEPSGEA
jgi:hypothetical protein